MSKARERAATLQAVVGAVGSALALAILLDQHTGGALRRRLELLVERIRRRAPDPSPVYGVAREAEEITRDAASDGAGGCSDCP